MITVSILYGLLFCASIGCGSLGPRSILSSSSSSSSSSSPSRIVARIDGRRGPWTSWEGLTGCMWKRKLELGNNIWGNQSCGRWKSLPWAQMGEKMMPAPEMACAVEHQHAFPYHSPCAELWLNIRSLDHHLIDYEPIHWRWWRFWANRVGKLPLFACQSSGQELDSHCAGDCPPLSNKKAHTHASNTVTSVCFTIHLSLQSLQLHIQRVKYRSYSCHLHCSYPGKSWWGPHLHHYSLARLILVSCSCHPLKVKAKEKE